MFHKQEMNHCRARLRIEGNGAFLICIPHKRFGRGALGDRALPLCDSASLRLCVKSVPFSTAAQVAGRSSGFFARPAITPAAKMTAFPVSGAGASWSIWYSICPRENGGAPVRHSYAIAAKE